MPRSLQTILVRFLTTSLSLIAVMATVSASDAVLIEFSSKNCVHCRAMASVMQQLQQEGVAIRHVDVDKESDMAVRFSVDQLPTYVIYANGKEAARLVGRQPIATVRQALMSTSHVRVTPTNSSANPNAAPQFASQSFASITPETRLVDLPGSPAANTLSAAPSSVSLQNVVARAEQATVRLRVFETEDVGFGVGTGTIVDAHEGEYLVLTCGHLFRDSQGKGKIEVDLFLNGQVHTVPGKLIDYNAKDRDIAVVSIETSLNIIPVPVLPNSQAVRNGESVFSYGCDRGADPSRRDTRITGINKYNQHLKLSNIEIEGAPIDGRSGGGLFDSQGRLVGVCNAADYKGNIGIYAGPGEVYWQLDRLHLASLFTSGSAPTMAASAQDNFQFASAQPSASPEMAPASPSFEQATSSDSDKEVIIIVRDRNRPDAPTRVKVLDRAPADVLRYVDSN